MITTPANIPPRREGIRETRVASSSQRRSQSVTQDTGTDTREPQSTLATDECNDDDAPRLEALGSNTQICAEIVCTAARKLEGRALE